MLTIKPDAAIAKFGSVFRGVLFLFHEGHPSRVLPSGKPGALQWYLRLHPCGQTKVMPKFFIVKLSSTFGP
ncbi:hypothetical protein, partial [uncultured Marivita sp.]|uniref:hypothetical protein n=1 Tax=uncultured Marivita sp. TaxID=888080 RepID=UPI0025EB19A4